MSDVTRILNAIEQGNHRAVDELLPVVYEELRCLAAQKLSQEASGQTLQATALVHEAYLRLVGQEDQKWDGKGHFFVAAAEAMRRILIDNARRKKSLRHGGDFQRIDLQKTVLTHQDNALLDDLIALDEALETLSRKDPVGCNYYSAVTTSNRSDYIQSIRTYLRRISQFSIPRHIKTGP